MAFAKSIEARCSVENEDAVGAAPTGDAPTTSELSTILLPTKVRLILEVLRYLSSLYKLNLFEENPDIPLHGVSLLKINSLRAKFRRGIINIHLHFMSLLHIDMSQVLKILPQVRLGPTHSTSISWLMAADVLAT